jgi:4-hydroxy-tetrahydrodipicolinate reductase
MNPIRIVVHGAAGRMGKRLIALATADNELKVVAALEHAAHPHLGRDAGVEAGVGAIDVPLLAEIPPEVHGDVMVDFSTPTGAAHAVELSNQYKLPLVMATTGLDESTRHQLMELSRKVAVVWSPNMSLAVNLTMKLVQQASQVLKDYPTGVDVEIVERHHRFKEDAPSGTALRFGEIISSIMGQSRHVHGRRGITGKRSREEIGYHALRVGDNPGEHTIIFAMLGETIELTVRASNRDCYAAGALQAAKFVATQPPGLYSMYDVLGFNTAPPPSA